MNFFLLNIIINLSEFYFILSFSSRSSMDRTPPCGGGNRGSIPRGSNNNYFKNSEMLLYPKKNTITSFIIEKIILPIPKVKNPKKNDKISKAIQTIIKGIFIGPKPIETCKKIFANGKPKIKAINIKAVPKIPAILIPTKNKKIPKLLSFKKMAEKIANPIPIKKALNPILKYKVFY